MLGADVGLYCLEVGKGACAAIIEPRSGQQAGANQATIVDVGENGVQLAQWLHDLNVNKIPAILLTHNDADHIGSLTSLVTAFKGKIGKVRFVMDRKKEPPFWFSAQKWVEDGWIQDLNIMGTSLSAKPGQGATVVDHSDGVGFTIRCAYPPTIFGIGFIAKLQSLWNLITAGTNQLSAVLRLSPPNAKNTTLALFGGDLDYKGWKYLVDSGHNLETGVFLIPHHGGPQRKSKKFGPSELAAATQAQYALISVGTENRDGHPHEDLVAAFRSAGAYVLCTQITQQCLPANMPPKTLPNSELLKRVPQNYCISPNGKGTACAGTIVVQFKNNGPVVSRLKTHQSKVNEIQNNGHVPLCRK